MSEEQPTTPPTEPTPKPMPIPQPKPEVSEKPLLTLANANDAIDRLKEQNDRKEALLAKEEDQRAQAVLGGQAEAGSQQVVEKTDDQKVTDRCNAMLEGTGLSI